MLTSSQIRDFKIMSDDYGEQKPLHVPVMVDTVIKYLNPVPGGTYIDATVGTGGHAEAILRFVGEHGRVIGIDRDPAMIEISRARFKGVKNFYSVVGNFANLRQILEAVNIKYVDGILMDLGVTLDQIRDPQKGLSYEIEGKLDMRIGNDCKLTAADIIHKYSEEKLYKVLKEYGEEPYAKDIAHHIVYWRNKNKIETTYDLVRLIQKVVRESCWRDTVPRVFQALRIEVNNEFENLRRGIEEALLSLKRYGRLVVITFHSLESRIVKNIFNSHVEKSTTLIQGGIQWEVIKPSVKILTSSAIKPEPLEIAQNKCSRSAQLRACEIIEPVLIYGGDYGKK